MKLSRPAAVQVLPTGEVAVQVGAKTNKNTYPLKKNTFIGDFIIAEGATGATDYNYEQYADGVLTINNVSWAELYGTPEIQTNGQRSGSHQPIPGTNGLASCSLTLKFKCRKEVERNANRVNKYY